MIKFQVLVTYRAPNVPQRQQRFNCISLSQVFIVRDREARNPVAVTIETMAILETWTRSENKSDQTYKPWNR